MRLPNGLPFAKSVWSKYISTEGLTWSADKRGKAGILCLAPYYEEVFEPDWEFDHYLDAAAKLREKLIAGDLRALYVLWLCNANSLGEEDTTVMEPPVPHGMSGIRDEAEDILNFFEVDQLLVEAAVSGSPAFDAQGAQDAAVNAWLKKLAVSRRNEITQRMLREDPVALKRELLSEIRDSQQTQSWPFEPPTRTVAQLREICESLHQEEDKKKKTQAAAKAKREADKVEKELQARIADMRSAPNSWLTKVSKLVEKRGTDNYREAASMLADLRDALGGEQGNKIARKHASHLAQKYPTLNVLKSSLRKKQLLD